MLNYDFSKREGLSKYEYLYQCIRADILSGKLAEGEKMPSKRQLAHENGVSLRTVMNAYDQLMMEGYLVSRERSGYYVVSDFSPVLRYQTLPEELLEKYVNYAPFFSNTSSNLEQHTLARFIKQGYFERHLNRMRKYYHGQGKTLLTALNEMPAVPVEKVAGAESGTHLLVRLNTSLPDEEIKQRAKDCGINLACLSEFCAGDIRKLPQYGHTLILNYSNMDQSRTREIIEILGEAISR